MMLAMYSARRGGTEGFRRFTVNPLRTRGTRPMTVTHVLLAIIVAFAIAIPIDLYRLRRRLRKQIGDAITRALAMPRDGAPHFIEIPRTISEAEARRIKEEFRNAFAGRVPR